jgi:hypothetical protein
VPALTGGHDVEGGVFRVDVFRSPDPVVDLDTLGLGQAPCFDEQQLGRVGSDDESAPACESPGERAGAGAQIEQVLTRTPDAHGCQAIEKLFWEPGAMDGVVLCRPAEVDPHAWSLAWIGPGDDQAPDDAGGLAQLRQHGGDRPRREPVGGM